MRRSMILLALASLASALLIAAPTHAGAGGYCSDGQFTDARGASVELSKYCFTPTVLRVQPGDEVTFTNVDPDLHMLGGVNNVFGNLHTELRAKDSISYTFEDEGVFPYLCILHPGMAGAIVVGDGEGKVTTSSVTGGTVVPPDDETSTGDSSDAVAARPDTRATSTNSQNNLGLWAALVVALGGAFWWLRRKPQAEV